MCGFDIRILLYRWKLIYVSLVSNARNNAYLFFLSVTMHLLDLQAISYGHLGHPQ